MFDLPPRWLLPLFRRGVRTSFRYKVPPMPFAMSAQEIAKMVDTIPGIRAVHDLPMPRGRGTILNVALWAVQRAPVLDGLRQTVTLLEFG